MDVQITYTFGALKTDGVSFESNYRPDADLATQISLVDITKEAASRADDFAICADATTVVSPGNIERTITLRLSADFVSRFPTEDLQRRSLANFFRRVLEMRVPFFTTVYETFVFGDPLCP